MVLLPCSTCCEWQCPACDSPCCPCPRWRDVWNEIFEEDQAAWDAYLGEHGIPAGTTYQELDYKCRSSIVEPACGYPGGAPGYIFGQVATWSAGGTMPISFGAGAISITGSTGDAIVDAMLASGWGGGTYAYDSVPFASAQECIDCGGDPLGECGQGASPIAPHFEYWKTVWTGTRISGQVQAFNCAPAECYRVFEMITKRDYCESGTAPDTYYEFEWRVCPCGGVTLTRAERIPNSGLGTVTTLSISLASQPTTSPSKDIFECYNLDNSWASYPIYPVPQPNPCAGEDNPCNP